MERPCKRTPPSPILMLESSNWPTAHRALPCPGSATHEPVGAGPAVGGIQAAIVAARGRADQDAARSPQTLCQASWLHAGADFAVGPLSGHWRGGIEWSAG